MDGGFSVQGYFLMILWSIGLECLVALLSVFSHLLFSFFPLEIRELIKIIKVMINQTTRY
jgi:cytochrome c biogenesis protein CcdA